MKDIRIQIDQRLKDPGQTLSLSDTIEQDTYRLGDHTFVLSEGIHYDITLTNTGEGILATGLVSANVQAMCDRCLDETSFDIASEMNEYYLFEAPSEDEQNPDEDEVDFSLIDEDQTINLSDALMASILMETPYVVLCSEDCKGLCPHCGCNLNKQTCDCEMQAQKEAQKEHPFAALANLDVKKDNLENK